jgi:hypothetical protein
VPRNHIFLPFHPTSHPICSSSTSSPHHLITPLPRIPAYVHNKDPSEILIPLIDPCTSPAALRSTSHPIHPSSRRTKIFGTDLGDVGSRPSQLTCPPRSATHPSTHPSNYSCTMHHVSTYQHHKRPRVLPGLPPSSPRFFFPLPSGRLLAG